ncbi:unnamed protein product [Orchesella dallaii]|uniref:Uncharacterized protein n=1 Tax=Orchesella dallaii TaxID=48710 RepID=A0ABP1R683_9HEXA
MSGVNKERNVSEVDSYDLNHSEYYVNSLLSDSSFLVNLSDGFGPEENLRTPFKGFTSADEDRLYTRQDVNTNILFEKVKVLSTRQKKAVVSLVKSQNGVIPIRKKNPKVVLYFERLVQAQTEAPPSATRSTLQRLQLQSKMEGKELRGEGQIGGAGKLIESGEEPEKSIPIEIPIKINEEEVILEDAMAPPQDEKSLPNTKRNQSESVMPPFKYPKMGEYSFDKTFPKQVGIKNPNDYGFNGKKEQKGASSWSPHSSFMGVASPVSVAPQFEGK